MKTLRLIIGISRGLIREQRARRTVMFYSVLAALVLLFIGATFLDEWLRERPLLFLLYWVACAWITLLAVLLACFDMLVVRARARGERRRLEAEYFHRDHPDDPRSR
jgi:protein-S-isoprenylcysteine O-methyltransferase Ste14